MTNRTPASPTARLVLPIAALALLVSAPPLSAAPSPSPAPRGPMLAPTAAERAFAVWRHARGVDGPQAPLFLPPAVPLQVQGGGNPDDVQWQAGFGLPIPDSFISTLVPFGSVLAVGGYFTRVGDLEAHGVAAWDGTKWSTLGDFPGEYVQDLVRYREGLLALGAYPFVWSWDGTAWTTLPPFPADPGSPVYYGNEIASQDGQVAVAVSTMTGGIGYRARVYLMSDAGWVPLGGYFSDEMVSALAWYQGRLYAAGRLENPSGPAALVNVWDGTAWQPAGPELARARWDNVRSLAVYGGELVAGGWFHSSPDVNGPAICYQSWNGTRWAPLGIGQPMSNLQRLRVIGTNLYAMGLFEADHRYGIARWDGTAWHSGEDHLRWMAWDVAPFGGEMYAGGALSGDGSAAATPLARLRSGRWEPAVTPGPGMQGIMGWDGPGVQTIEAVDGGIVAAGRLEFAGASGGWVPFTGTARWDGAHWSAFGDGTPEDDIEPIDLAWHQGALYAAGYFQRGADGSGGYGSVARFENGRWVLFGGLYEPFLNATCLTSAFGNLFLGGGIPYGGTGGMARWDGTQWHALGRGITAGNYITSMTAHGDELIVGGDFTEMDGVPCRHVAAWNLRDGWHALAEGLDGTAVTDLISKDGVLYASFLCAQRGVARWANDHWEQLDSPGSVWALGWYRGRLLASSDGFCGRIAYLDGAGAWRPLGSGLNAYPAAFVEQGQSLFVGGRFSTAGGKPSFGFAEWLGPLPGDDGTPYPTPDPTPASAAYFQRVLVDPNPSGQAVHLRYDLPAAGSAKVEIYDLTGHLVATPFDGQQSAGPQDVVWTPDKGQVSAGVYFARVTAANTKRVVRVVRIE